MTNAWYLREPAPGPPWRVACWFDDRFPDGSTVPDGVDPGDLSGSLRIWRTDVDPSGRVVIEVDGWAAADAPACWYVAITPVGEARPTATLVAYPTPHLPPGTVISDRAFFGLPVRSAEQIAAIRWWRDEACVDQVYVGREYRRTHLATKVIYAASAFHQANGWPGRLHSDGRRTDLGQRLVAGLRHAERIAPWETRLAPLDPEPT